MSGGFDYIEGGAFKKPDDILIDDDYAAEKKLHVGDTINLMNQNWRVSGIFAHGKLSRIILPLQVVQDLTASIGRVSFVYLKFDNAANTGLVIEALKKQLPTIPWLNIFRSSQLINYPTPTRSLTL